MVSASVSRSGDPGSNHGGVVSLFLLAITFSKQAVCSHVLRPTKPFILPSLIKLALAYAGVTVLSRASRGSSPLRKEHHIR